MSLATVRGSTTRGQAKAAFFFSLARTPAEPELVWLLRASGVRQGRGCSASPDSRLETLLPVMEMGERGHHAPDAWEAKSLERGGESFS